MELRLKPIGPSRSAHEQASWGCIKTDYWWLGFVVLLPCFCERGKTVAALLYSALIIVKSLQLRECKQIAEPRKYCLVRVIVFFLWCVFFSIFLFLKDWEFEFNSLHTHLIFATWHLCVWMYNWMCQVDTAIYIIDARQEVTLKLIII